jgi:Zn-dependent peptidase ImmA (M78 family)
MSQAISNSRFRQITELANEMIRQNSISKPNVPIEKISRKEGVQVVEADLGNDISGMLVINGDTAVIGISPGQTKERKRFTIAHELGHFLLHKDSKNSVFLDRDFIVKYRSNKPYSDIEIRQEQEANAFAAAILMPQQLILAELDKSDFQDLSETELINELALLFNVSVPAMTYRLLNLNILF